MTFALVDIPLLEKGVATIAASVSEYTIQPGRLEVPKHSEA